MFDKNRVKSGCLADVNMTNGNTLQCFKCADGSINLRIINIDGDYQISGTLMKHEDSDLAEVLKIFTTKENINV